MSSADADPREHIEGAVEAGVPLSSFVGRCRLAMRRAKASIASAPRGAEFDRHYLRKGSHADLSAMAALVCDADEIERLLYNGGVPIVESSRFAADGERAYRTIYARVRRRYGAAAASGLTGKGQERPTNFFMINADELAHAG